MLDMLHASDHEIAQFYGGTPIPLLGRTLYDFSYLPSSGSETVHLARALSVVYATSAVLVVRIHVNGLGTGASIDVKCYPTAPSSEDPTEFSDSSTDLSATVSTQTAPFYLQTSRTTPPTARGGRSTSSPTSARARRSTSPPSSARCSCCATGDASRTRPPRRNDEAS